MSRPQTYCSRISLSLSIPPTCLRQGPDIWKNSLDVDDPLEISTTEIGKVGCLSDSHEALPAQGACVQTHLLILTREIGTEKDNSLRVTLNLVSGWRLRPGNLPEGSILLSNDV